MPPASHAGQYRTANPETPYVGPHFAGPSEHGWLMKALWVMDGRATTPVSVRAAKRGGGPPLWFQPGDATRSTTLLLDPKHPGIPVQHGDWREWPSYLYFPETGCYEIEASWPGGGWTAQIPFVSPADALPEATPIPPPATPVAP